MFIMTINVTLPELETVVTVTNSLYNYGDLVIIKDIKAKAYVFYSDTIWYDIWFRDIALY